MLCAQAALASGSFKALLPEAGAVALQSETAFDSFEPMEARPPTSANCLRTS